MKINSMLLCDYYKNVHGLMLPKGCNKIVSYYTPRMSRIKAWNKCVNFGLQGFVKEVLIEDFNENFFNRPKKEVVDEYVRMLDTTLGKGSYNPVKWIEDLHDLGYLPIEIGEVPEGVSVPMGTPMFYITNTKDEYAWLTMFLESLISSEVWHPMVCATMSKHYKGIVDKYWKLTCDEDKINPRRLLGSFDFRGEESYRSAIKAASAWLIYSDLTATVPANTYIEQYYKGDITKEVIGLGAPSTEHSVMCSNFFIDGNEETMIKRLLNEIYPNTSFTCVCDSYNYWNVVENILPKLKDDILKHNGCFSVRGDSGNCVEVVTKTVFKLWDIFGGTTNSKGYKVLDPHIKAIYGDSITVQRCEEIYKILEENGFAISNVSLGVGSFSFQCIEEEGELKPFTRDTFSSCIKATYCEVNHKPTPIFKNPIEGGFKKSQKGCCIVNKDLTYFDGYNWNEAQTKENLLQPIFKDGKMVKEYSFSEVKKNAGF